MAKTRTYRLRVTNKYEDRTEKELESLEKYPNQFAIINEERTSKGTLYTLAMSDDFMNILRIRLRDKKIPHSLVGIN